MTWSQLGFGAAGVGFFTGAALADPFGTGGTDDTAADFVGAGPPPAGVAGTAVAAGPGGVAPGFAPGATPLSWQPVSATTPHTARAAHAPLVRLRLRTARMVVSLCRACASAAP
ncbi:hypothetical protein ACIBEA_01270 [Streptomyces sp. NPDC051555]|uniref:hypothetical protein n=1 Tax=Streptomyces sp. NPDC051555 TaxID=3365657 RepID=UPI0037B4C147